MSRIGQMELEQNPPLKVLVTDMERFIHDPLGWVHYVPWATEVSSRIFRPG